MASFNGSFEVSGSAKVTNALDLGTPVDAIAIGSTNFDEISISLKNGTGSGQCNEHWHDERTVAAGATDNLDLSGGLTSGLGVAITFTSIKLIIIDIDTPLSTKSLRVGPRGQGQAAQLWFGGVAATDYMTIARTLFFTEPIAGWTVTAGSADVLGIYNSGSVSCTYRIYLAGVD